MKGKVKKPRTRHLLQMAGGAPIRLLNADRSFLSDLARVGFIDEAVAANVHYAHLKSGASRSLSRLEKAGLVRPRWVRQKGERIRAWTFAADELAKAWGGQLPVTGSTRSEYHELLVSRLYFELGRPEDFRVAAAFTADDIAFCGTIKPDAMYTSDDGEMVYVEADSGHYTRSQIQKKMNRWQGIRQIWGQPARPTAPIGQHPDIAVYQF